MASHIERRKFLATLGGAAAAWPFAARAQQIRRLAVLMGSAESDQDSQVRLTAFREALRQDGWTEGSNLRIDYRWAAADPDRIRVYAEELVGLKPDAILAHAPAALKAVQRETRNIPIVFVMVPVPVAREVVASLARPEGNITGFAHTDVEIAGKWLELLKEISPAMKRIAFLLDPDHPAWAAYSRTITAAASSFGVEVIPGGIRDAAEIEHLIEGFSREPNGGLIVLPTIVTQVHRDLIVRLAARHRLPAISGFRYFPSSGGLMSYGIDPVDLFRRSASYMDRILKGAKVSELPVQAADKFELVINLKTAKAMGLDVPWFLQQRADEVIE
jgi:ABC-type uncharacterized transport system substrate-binding protein